MAPIAAKMPEVLAAIVERMRWFMIIDYASSWADQVPTLMGRVPEGRATVHLKIVVPTLLVGFSLLQRHEQQIYKLSKMHCQQLIKRAHCGLCWDDSCGGWQAIGIQSGFVMILQSKTRKQACKSWHGEQDK